MEYSKVALKALNRLHANAGNIPKFLFPTILSLLFSIRFMTEKLIIEFGGAK